MAGKVQWKRYVFFDKEPLCDNVEATLNGTVTSFSTEGSMIIFGDSAGVITLTDRSFNVIWNVKVFNGPVRGVSYVYDPVNNKKQFIVAIGEESKGNEAKISSSDRYVIKIFLTSDMTRPIQSFHAATGVPEDATLTAFAVSLHALQIAVGFSNGATLLFSASLNPDGSIPKQYSQLLLISKHKFSCSGLYFCEPFVGSTKYQPNERFVRLFTVYNTTVSSNESDFESLSESGIVVHDTSIYANESSRALPKVLDSHGAAPWCSSFMRQTSELICGRNEGVFTYSIEDRGGAAGIEGVKQCVSSIGRYILVAGPDEKAQRNTVTIYDLRNKFISMTHLLAPGDNVSMIHHDNGIAYILTTAKQLIRIREKDTAAKIEVLLKKNLFPLAISLAAEEQTDVSEIMKLFKSFGDYLFKKTDYEAAITQYCHTIGYVQPSYVIRRYLDTQRIVYLTVYLEELHIRGVATKDHTTLLLTCYTKSNNTSKLEQFIRMIKGDNEQQSDNSIKSTFGMGKSSYMTKRDNKNFDAGPKFSYIDIEAVIKSLKDEGFTEYSLSLAQFSRYHEYAIEIRLQSGKSEDANIALAYLVQLALKEPMDSIVPLLLKFGRKFLSTKPDAFTAFLIQLCTGVCFADLLLQDSSKEQTLDSPLEPVLLQDRLAVEEVLKIFPDYEFHLKVFLEGVAIAMKDRILSPKFNELLLEMRLIEFKQLKDSFPTNSESGASDSTATLDHAFKIRTVEEKALALLDGNTNLSSKTEYDICQALLLCQQFGFDQGVLFLLDKFQSTDLILNKYIETGDEKGIMKILKREGRKDSELYVQVLTYFVRLSINANSNHDEDDEDDEERWDQIVEVLSSVTRENVLTPLQVVPILSMNPQLPISIVSKFLKKSLMETSEEIKYLELSTAKKKMDIQEYLQQEKLTKILGGDASSTKGSLKGANPFEDEDEDDYELQRVAAERETERSKWLTIRKNLEQSSIDPGHAHEAFIGTIEHSADGFKTVATHFGQVLIS